MRPPAGTRPRCELFSTARRVGYISAGKHAGVSKGGQVFQRRLQRPCIRFQITKKLSQTMHRVDRLVLQTPDPWPLNSHSRSFSRPTYPSRPGEDGAGRRAFSSSSSWCCYRLRLRRCFPSECGLAFAFGSRRYPEVNTAASSGPFRKMFHPIAAGGRQ